MKSINNEQLKELNNLSNELKDNFDDLDKTNEILTEMLGVLGEKPKFGCLEDFVKFMESDEVLVF